MSSITTAQVVWVLQWILFIATCSFAIWKGGAPERSGGILLFAAAVINAFFDFTPDDSIRSIVRLTGDGLLAVGFLLIALRYGSLWLGGAMLLQAVQFSLHAFYFITERPNDLLHVVVNNVDTFGIVACMLVGTIAAMRRRRKLSPAKAEA